MNGYYTIHKRKEDGTRGEMVMGVSKITMTLYWGKLSKFQLDGVSVGTVPVTDGDSLIIYRNGKMFFEGLINDVTTNCQNPLTDVRKWKAQGVHINALFGYRYVVGEPLTLDFDSKEVDKIEDTSWNRLVHYIENAFGTGTVYERQLAPLTLPKKQAIGTVALSSYRKQMLDQVLSDISKEDDLYPQLHQDDKTGWWSVTIPEARNMTQEIYISPAFGNVTKWQREEKKPDFTVVWVLSGEYEAGQLYAYAEDKETTAIYGRIEKIVNRTDLTPSEEEELTTEAVEDKDKSHLTEEDVLLLLEQEAKVQLRDHGQKVTWSVEAAETRQMAFMDNWKLGDKVTCILDGERFEASISQVKITYEKGFEKVVPTIGNVTSEVFGQIFDLIKGLDKKVTDLENS